jgi:hypothetical protein
METGDNNKTDVIDFSEPSNTLYIPHATDKNVYIHIHAKLK